MQFSGSCNPDFVDVDGDDCNEYHMLNSCSTWSIKSQVRFAKPNEEGYYETGLNCPQCGCESNVGVNLNDLYAQQASTSVETTTSTTTSTSTSVV